MRVVLILSVLFLSSCVPTTQTKSKNDKSEVAVESCEPNTTQMQVCNSEDIPNFATATERMFIILVSLWGIL